MARGVKVPVEFSCYPSALEMPMIADEPAGTEMGTRKKPWSVEVLA